MTLRLLEKKFANMSPKKKMLLDKTTQILTNQTKMNFMVMKKPEIFVILTEVSWIQDILVMVMVSFWKNWILDPTGNLIDMLEIDIAITCKVKMID